MFWDHLILPLLLLLLSYRSVWLSSPSVFSGGRAPPPARKVNLKVCEVALLCVLTSRGHCWLNQEKRENQRWSQDQQQDSSTNSKKINFYTRSIARGLIIIIVITKETCHCWDFLRSNLSFLYTVQIYAFNDPRVYAKESFWWVYKWINQSTSNTGASRK